MIECLATGAFSKAPPCKPVSCGVPEQVNHALHINTERFYTETVTYACLIGYTLTGEADGKSWETLECNAFGKFDKPYPKCKPVVCGKPPEEDHASTERTGKVYFDQAPVDYKCEKGYSTVVNDSPYEPSMANF